LRKTYDGGKSVRRRRCCCCQRQQQQQLPPLLDRHLCLLIGKFTHQLDWTSKTDAASQPAVGRIEPA
jgi:hypothetical protein